MTFISSFKKTRIAPTPSGYLHLGNLLSFILTIAVARKSGASVLLRIDDLDQARYKDDYVQDIFDTLNFLELPWDEGPRNLNDFKSTYSQMHRLPIYEQLLQQLYNENKLFACSCSRSQLAETALQGMYPGTCITHQVPYAAPQTNWRLLTDPYQLFPIRTIDQQIVNASLPPQMHYFVVRKKDAMPAYQIASLADDLHFGIDLIVRGQDLWPSTIAQICLAEQLSINSFRESVFFHHPLLTDDAGNKLSKSAGAVSVRYLRKEGKSKEDIFAILARHTALKGNISNWETFAGAYFATHKQSASPTDAD